MTRLLLNAEPFGFGPTAAIAGFFPHLQKHFPQLAYLGAGHTLDLQRELPYAQIHDSGKMAASAVNAVLTQYDVLFSVTDFATVAQAQACGLRTCVYDPLAWYWPALDPAILACDLYLAQAFIGVEKRLADLQNRIKGHVRMVPPVVPAKVAPRHATHTLINLGGLQNPYWPLPEVVRYAEHVLAALLPLVEQPVIVTSLAVLEQLPKALGARTASHAEMQALLAGARLAVMTPGLGNMYDAAHYGNPTLWLPPANDSQGQQLTLVRESGAADGWLDWSDVLPAPAIDYRQPQREVLAAIAAAVRQLAQQPALQERLRNGLQTQLAKVAACETSAMTRLVARFGRGGAAAVAESVAAFCRHGNGGN